AVMVQAAMNSADTPRPLWGKLHQLVQLLSTFLLPAHKRRFYLVSLWACGLSILEMLAAAAVIPYVACLGGNCPAFITTTMARWDLSTIPAMSLGLFLLITVKLVVQAMLSRVSIRFTQQVQQDTISRLLAGYMFLDWPGFRSESRTHYFRRCATTAVDAAYVSQQCVTLVSSALILLFLTGLMLWKYPLASLLLTGLFLALNFLAQAVLGRAQKQAGHEREQALQQWSNGMAEAFASFREIRVYGLERFFLQHIDRAINNLAKANVRLNFLPTLPRLVLDFTVLGILLFVVTLWMLLQRPLAELLPQLVFYAVVARTMLPAMMNLLSTRTGLLGAIVNIELVLKDLDRAGRGRVERIGIAAQVEARPAFRFEGVTFRHAVHLPPVLDAVDLTLPHPSWLAIVGPSGAGKSTLMELLCGIHAPQSGRVVHAWHGGRAPSVAYLPQHVALLDDSILQNIVFGFDAGDAGRVDAAIALAGLAQVVRRLPGGRDAPVGTDGTNLSGGERQRLALARAIYRHPDLLLLDEATSGLDEATETQVLEGLRRE
ncbi:MAG: ABC transporter ATP-binding protein, partial [Haliea sp.]